MTWERETEHLEKALDERAGPFQVPETAWLIQPIARQIQELEDAVWQIFDSRFIDLATGDALEILGAIVGEYDDGGTDEDFRLRIRLKLKAIVSQGRQLDYFDLLNLIEGSTWSVQSRPGWALLIQRTGPPMDSATLFRMAKIASADGVLVRFEAYEDEDTDFFTWPSQDGSITGGEWASQDTTIPGDAWPGVRQQ